jgi:hypothetical protein
MRETDNVTIQALQLRAPRSSKNDARVLQQLLENDTLFPTVKDPEKRASIWDNILSIEGLIPSLYTFFEDLKLLRPCAEIIKSLIELPLNGSLREMIEQRFTGCNQSSDTYYYQITETTWGTMKGGLQERVEFGWQQLLFYILRHSRKMNGWCPKKEIGRPKPVAMEPDPITWYEFGQLASRLGFDSTRIRELNTDDPYKKSAREYLQKSHRSLHTIDKASFESCIKQIAKTLQTATEKEQRLAMPVLVTSSAGESLSRRCGRFFETAHDQDRDFLFLGTLHDTSSIQRGNSITSFFVRRSIYFAFFGTWPASSVGPITQPQRASDAPSLHGEPTEPAREPLITSNQVALVPLPENNSQDLVTTGEVFISTPRQLN